jgi:hypothetical protein
MGTPYWLLMAARPIAGVVQCEIGSKASAVLSEETDIFAANLEGSSVALFVSAGDARQILCKVRPGFTGLETRVSRC